MQPHQSEFDPARFPLPAALHDALLASGWEDVSWHNDACPSFLISTGPGRALRLWIDAEHPAERELGGARFSLCAEEEGVHSATLWQAEEPADAARRILDT